MTSRLMIATTLFLLATACKDKAPPAASNAPAADKPTDKPADKPVEAVKAPEPPPAPAGPTWEKYTSKEGGFTIELPGKPDVRAQGPLTMVGAEFGVTGADSRTSMCGATHMDMGEAGKGDPKTILDGATARHKEGAKIIEEKDIKVGKHPGRTLVIENSSHRKWMSAYLVDKTIYIVNCGGPFDRAATDGPIAQRVLASFALTK